MYLDNIYNIEIKENTAIGYYCTHELDYNEELDSLECNLLSEGYIKNYLDLKFDKPHSLYVQNLLKEYRTNKNKEQEIIEFFEQNIKKHVLNTIKNFITNSKKGFVVNSIHGSDSYELYIDNFRSNISSITENISDFTVVDNFTKYKDVKIQIKGNGTCGFVYSYVPVDWC